MAPCQAAVQFTGHKHFVGFILRQSFFHQCAEVTPDRVVVEQTVLRTNFRQRIGTIDLPEVGSRHVAVTVGAPLPPLLQDQRCGHLEAREGCLAVGLINGQVSKAELIRAGNGRCYTIYKRLARN